MVLVLLRHADKRMSPLDPDVALTPLGEQQAVQIVENVHSARMPTPTHLWSSPRRRARATLQPLAENLHLPIQVSPELDERHSHERTSDFHIRIEQFVASLGDGIHFCCTHADWLHEAVLHLPTDIPDTDFEAHFVCAQARTFVFEGGLWHYRGTL